MVESNVAAAPESALESLRLWSARQYLAAALAAAAITFVIGLPTDVIPNPVFGRPVPVTWWSYPTLLVTAVLGGLLAGTYVRRDAAPITGPITGPVTGPVAGDEIDAPTRNGGVAGLLSFFAVGCPVCNKLVIVALGTTGARQWFEPVQPILAITSIVLLGWALRARLRSAESCRIG